MQDIANLNMCNVNVWRDPKVGLHQEVILSLVPHPSFGGRGDKEIEQLQGTVVDMIEIGKHAIKLSEKDTVVVSVSVLYRVPCARYT
jgi:hypothetical protein